MTDSTNICDRCSAPVPTGAIKCPNCGAPLTEAAATGFETTKIGDVFATTKLEMPSEEPIQEVVIEEPAAPEPAPSPDPIQVEPNLVAPPPVEPTFTPPTRSESAQPAKEWYKNPLVIGLGCVVLFLCCACVAIIAAAVALLPAGL